MARTVFPALIALAILAGLGSAAPARAAPQSPPAAKAAGGPTWKQLSAQQRKVLAPLAAQWDQMPERQRTKLIRVADRYPKMTPQEQQRVRERLTEWARLSPQERDLARERYRKLKQLPPEKHREVKKKWEQYQAEKRSSAQALQPSEPPEPYPQDGGTEEP